MGLGLSPGCYPGLVHRCPSGTGLLGVGDWFLRVVGRKTGGIGGRIWPGCHVGLEETRDDVTGCPTRWFCPYGTTIGLGRWVGGVWGWIWPGCCVGLGLSPGWYPGLVHRCPSGTGLLGVGDWCGRGLGACGRAGLKRDHLGGLAFEEQAGAGGSHWGWVSDGVVGIWEWGLKGFGNGGRGSEPRAAVR